MIKGIALMLLSSLTTCTGQMFWKLSSVETNGFLLLILGFGLYGLGALSMIIAFRFGDVSVLQPMLSIGFVISLFLAVIILGETVSLQKIAGVIMIIAGMIFLGISGKVSGK